MSKYTNLIAVPEGINVGLRGTRNRLMLSLLGSPRSNYSRNCQSPTNERFLSRVSWGKDVGPFKVSGFDLAVASLKEVMDDIRVEQKEVYDLLSTAGMMCCRYVRGSSASISNHSWGTAVDLKIDDVLDRRGNNKVQYGLSLIAPIFHKHGWFWGAGFTVEDGMHFEVSEEKMLQWQAEGKLFDGRTLQSHATIHFGDRGEDVRDLQLLLNKLDAGLSVDGIFGSGTYGAVIEFQAMHGLEPDGIVGTKSWEKLEMVTGV
jgi:hypothetical protein